jgi:hypothetical protein
MLAKIVGAAALRTYTLYSILTKPWASRSHRPLIPCSPINLAAMQLLINAPHCLKWNAVSVAMQISLISRTQLSSMAREFGPLSPPAVTQSMPVTSMAANEPNSGSPDRNYTTAAVSRKRSNNFTSI